MLRRIPFPKIGSDIRTIVKRYVTHNPQGAQKKNHEGVFDPKKEGTQPVNRPNDPLLKTYLGPLKGYIVRKDVRALVESYSDTFRRFLTFLALREKCRKVLNLDISGPKKKHIMPPPPQILQFAAGTLPAPGAPSLETPPPSWDFQ